MKQKPQKYSQDEDFKISDALMSLKGKRTFDVDESYFETNEDLWFSESRIRAIAPPDVRAFTVPSPYFENFPKRISEIINQQTQLSKRWILTQWAYAAAAVLALVLLCYPLFKPAEGNEFVTQPTAIHQDELYNYLQENLFEYDESDFAAGVQYNPDFSAINMDKLIEEHPFILNGITPEDLQSL
jgi:hypothetical protein